MIRRTSLYASLLCLAATLNLYAAWPLSYDQVKVSTINEIVPWSAGGAAIGTGQDLVIVDSAGAVLAARKTTPFFLRLARGTNDTLFVSEFALSDLAIAKLDANLQVVWATRVAIGGTKYRTNGIAGTRDGGVIAVGQLDDAAMAVRFDANGGVRWAKRLDLSGKESLARVIQTRDGEFAAVGHQETSGWIVKLRDDGSVAWQKTVARPLAVVAEAPDGNIVGAGPGWFVRTDAKGEGKWQTSTTVDVASIAFNGSVLAAAGRFQTSMVVLALDPTGAMQWSRQLLPGGTPGIIASGSGWLTFSSVAHKAVLQRIEPTAASTCGSVATSDVAVTPASVALQTLPIEVSSLTPATQKWALTFTDLPATASPFACANAPASPPPSVAAAPATEFDPYAHIRDRATQWRELLAKRDYEQLDRIGEELMQKPWSANPAQWDINVLIGVLQGDPQQSEEQRLAQLRDWLAKRPQSAIARVALTQSLIAAGYKRRGGGYAGTVTDTGWKELEAFFAQARDTLAPIQGAERIPGYWTARIELATHYNHETVRDVALLAVKHTTDPETYRVAMHYSLPRWGGTPEGIEKLARDLATRAATPWGDVIYMWIALQAYLQLTPEEYRAANFEWSRINKGSRDLIAMSPKYLPSYHRYARLAHRLNQRAIARDLFRSPELNWYPGAEQWWNGRANYDEARAWALKTPDSADTPPSSAATLNAPSAQSQKAAPFTIKPITQWPQLLMQNEATFAGVTRRGFASFLVSTPKGTVAISVLPPYTPKEHTINWVEHHRASLSAWSMASPAAPKRILEVASMETKDAHVVQQAVALALKPMKGDLPVPVLQLAPSLNRPRETRVFVVACIWKNDQCTQKVVNGIVLWSNAFQRGSSYTFGTDEPLPPESLPGAAVLDVDGHVIAIGKETRGGYKLLGPYIYPLDAEEIANALP